VVSVTLRSHFTPRESIPEYPIDRRLDGLTAEGEAEVRIKIFCPCREPNTGRPLWSDILQTELSRLVFLITVLNYYFNVT
jgi:hypothetical protein